MIARGGYSWIASTLLISSVCLLYYLLVNIFIFVVLTIILLILDLFFLYFFRDPTRRPGRGIVSPADGKIISITTGRSTTGIDSYHQKPGVVTRIAIFMSPFNVHVNRASMGGVVMSIDYKPGGFIPAYRLESILNERQITTLQTSIGIVKIVQIAGTIAKRIVPYINIGQRLKKGQRIGIIQFGSRVDLILPANKVKVMVKLDDKVKAGVTTIAEINNYRKRPN